jgi:hypothetical protein
MLPPCKRFDIRCNTVMSIWGMRVQSKWWDACLPNKKRESKSLRLLMIFILHDKLSNNEILCDGDNRGIYYRGLIQPGRMHGLLSAVQIC